MAVSNRSKSESDFRFSEEAEFSNDIDVRRRAGPSMFSLDSATLTCILVRMFGEKDLRVARSRDPRTRAAAFAAGGFKIVTGLSGSDLEAILNRAGVTKESPTITENKGAGARGG
jgi:hypothetical protein